MDNRVALEIGSIIDAYDYDNGIKENTRYVIKEVIGYGGSGIVYGADKIDDKNIPIGQVCLKEYYPASGFTRDLETYKIKAADNDISLTESVHSRAINEMSIGRKVRFKSKNIAGNMQTINIRTLLVARSIQLGKSKKVIDCSDNSEWFALMDDYSFACTLSDMPNRIRHERNETTKLLQRGLSAFSFYAVLDITEKVLNALSLVHEKNVLYCDIQPRNILFDTHTFKSEVKSDEIGAALFIDFGASIDLDEAEQNTHPNTVYVSRDFRAPEQNPEEKELFGKLSFATDIYQVGMLFWYLMTGQIEDSTTRRNRFDGDYTVFSDYGILSKHIEKVARIIQKATNRNPGDRYELKELLEEIVELKKWYRTGDLSIDKDYYIPSNLIKRDYELEEISKIIDASTEPLFVWSKQKGFGKATLLRMYANRENLREEVKHNVYIVDFINNVNETVSKMHINGDCNGSFDENIKLLNNLDPNDVLVILGFNHPEPGGTPYDLMDEYYERIRKIPAKIVITTDYGMSKHPNNYLLRPLSNNLVLEVLDRFNKSTDHDSFDQKQKLTEIVEGNPKLLSMIVKHLEENDTLAFSDLVTALESRPDNNVNLDDIPNVDKLNTLSKYSFYKSLYTFDDLTVEQKMILKSILLIPKCGISFRLYMDALQECFSDRLSSGQIRNALTQLSRKGWIELGLINRERFVGFPNALIKEIVLEDKKENDSDNSSLLLTIYDLLSKDESYYENKNSNSWHFWCSITLHEMSALKDRGNKEKYHRLGISAIRKRLKDDIGSNTSARKEIVNRMIGILDSQSNTDNYFSEYYLSLMLLEADRLEVLCLQLLDDVAKVYLQNKKYDEAGKIFDLLIDLSDNIIKKMQDNERNKKYPQVGIFPYSWEVSEGVFGSRQNSSVIFPACLTAGFAFYEAHEYQIAKPYLITSLKKIGEGCFILRKDWLEKLYKYLYRVLMETGDSQRAEILSYFQLA